MTPAPILPDEDERLQALHQLLILDTPPEERFDRIVAFAAEEFDMPIAQMSLLDADRQWAKSRVGIDGDAMARSHSVCGHFVGNPTPMAIEDLTQDTRFRDNPVLIDENHLRFYAGSPLVMPSGHVIGALCVMDRQPRTFDATDQAILNTLRDLVVRELVREADDARD